MVQLTRVWPGGMSLALISLSVLGCSDESNPTRNIQLETLALEETDGGTAPDASSAAEDAAVSCSDRDVTCDSIDDDCDGNIDEDFPWRCIFGAVAVRCVNGLVEAEICGDSDACTTDSCSAGICQLTPVTCDDENPCTVDSCSAGTCQSTPTTGGACDDDNPCTLGDVCDAAGSCGSGTSIEVDDGDPCTADSCDPEYGVMHTPAVGASCDDGNSCTELDVCKADGACAGAPRMDIADSDPCTADICDPATGAVTHEVVPASTSCFDGDACNGSETCELLPERTFTVESRSTFNRVDSSDDSNPPQILRLADVGLSAGQRVRFQAVGVYQAPAVSRVMIVFSTNSTLLDEPVLNRVPGALQSDGPDFVTWLTYFEHQVTDIPQDFMIDTSVVDVTIPANAEYMFLGNYDAYMANNTGTIKLIVQSLALSCVPGTPPVLDDGDACTADACDAIEGVTHTPIDNCQ